jgi:glycosyltransferase involved in cell wall biosynthesis
LAQWARPRRMPTLYHEMGEADEAYVATWSLRSTVAVIDEIDRVVCCSTNVAANIRRVYGRRGPVDTVPFMIEDPGELPAEAAPPRPLTLGTIGRLVPHKRVDDILRALARLRGEGLDVRLVVAGSGPERPALEAGAASLGIADRVVFTGEFESLREVMRSFDVLVTASASESQCMPIVESMAYGKAVIATRFGGMPDFVEEGRTGLLVPVGDVPALAAAAARFHREPGLKDALGAAGRARYLERYTPERVTDAMERVYAALPGLGG